MVAEIIPTADSSSEDRETRRICTKVGPTRCVGGWAGLHIAKGIPGRLSLRQPASREKRTAKNGCATKAKTQRAQPKMAVPPGRQDEKKGREEVPSREGVHERAQEGAARGERGASRRDR
jgi:hypothetical protein